MLMLTGNGENYRQRRVEDSQNWLFAKRLDKEVCQLGFQVCQPWKYRALYHLNVHDRVCSKDSQCVYCMQWGTLSTWCMQLMWAVGMGALHVCAFIDKIVNALWVSMFVYCNMMYECKRCITSGGAGSGSGETLFKLLNSNSAYQYKRLYSFFVYTDFKTN